MSYCDQEKLKLAAAFVDREISRECERIEEMRGREEQALKEQIRLKELQKKRDVLAEESRKVALTQEMFAFGGESLEQKDPVAREMRQVEQELHICRGRLKELERQGLPTKADQEFLAKAKMLEEQAEQLWNRRLIPKAEFVGTNASLVLQAKGAVLKSCMSIWNTQWYQKALKVLEDYWSIQKETAATAMRSPEMAAFLSIAPHLRLWLAVQTAVEGDLLALEGQKETLIRSLKEIAVCSLAHGYSAFPALASVWRIETEAGMDREAFVFLGDCYGYSDPKKRKQKQQFAEKWLSWFGRAMEDEAADRRLEGALKAGFSVFLECYGKEERKCLGDALKKWKRWPHQKRFAKYEEDFQKTISGYMQTQVYVARAIEALWGSTEKYPFLKGMNEKGGGSPRGMQWQRQAEIVSFFREDFLKDWLTLDLNPANWKPAWVERSIRRHL